MSEHKTQQKEFDLLLAKLIDNVASRDDIQALLALVKSNAEFKYALRAQLEMDELSRLVFEPETQSEFFISETQAKAEITTKTDDFELQVLSVLARNEAKLQSPRVLKKALPWALSLVSVAASLILVLFVFFDSEGQRPDSSLVELEDSGVALVVNATGLPLDSPYKSGVSVQPGFLLLEQGGLELEFYQGAQLKILGPAELELISEKHVRLIHGKVMTEVPELAIGFTIDTPQSSLVDLGTSIGVEVDQNGAAEVHVFDGLLEARAAGGDSLNLSEGQALKLDGLKVDNWRPIKADEKGYQTLSLLSAKVEQEQQNKHRRWQALHKRYINDESLLAYYDFEPNTQKPRLLNNVADSANAYAGAIVGAQWVQGPWPGKSALDFKRAGDRVRLNIDQTMTSFSLAAWVKVDSLDRTYNSLLLTDGFKPGDVHWQLGMFDINKRWGTVVLGLKTSNLEEMHFNHYPFFNSAEPGSWHHLVATVDQEQEQAVMYIDGRKVFSSRLESDSQYWKIGQASIGNWNSQQRANPVRNLNGAMAELMIFERALLEPEVQALALLKK